VECILNDRPLTPVSADSKDLLALTPNTLLKGVTDSALPPDDFIKSDVYRKLSRKIGCLANKFWARCLKCYLSTLQQRQKWLCHTRNLKVGDLVLTANEPHCREHWPLKRHLLIIWERRALPVSGKGLQLNPLLETFETGSRPKFTAA